jgi:hypothetical protein
MITAPPTFMATLQRVAHVLTLPHFAGPSLTASFLIKIERFLKLLRPKFPRETLTKIPARLFAFELL